MDLVIGGAYQGKTEFAKASFGLTDGDISVCSAEKEPDKNKRCLCHYEQYVLYCMRRGTDDYLRPAADAVLLCSDIFCGVVPLDQEIREWRERTGRALSALAVQADSVTRLFCGIPQKLK